MQPRSFGHALATRRAEVVDGIDRFTHELLSHGKGAAVILDAAVLDPHSAMANACCAAMYLFLQTAEGRRRAAPWLERAHRAAARSGVGERERDYRRRLRGLVPWRRAAGAAAPSAASPGAGRATC